MDLTLHQLRTMSRMRTCLLLPLLLILSQHGAWLHELSHAVYAAHSHPITFRQAQASAENGVCPSCQSFGQLGSALANPIAAFAATVTHFCPQIDLPYSSPAARRSAPRNRGPPLLA
ncbi:MAG: hypothetical protein WDM77_19765 [Steroidobacteraceae bacterium]